MVEKGESIVAKTLEEGLINMPKVKRLAYVVVEWRRWQHSHAVLSVSAMPECFIKSDTDETAFVPEFYDLLASCFADGKEWRGFMLPVKSIMPIW